jgi:hypothetical protein
MAQPDSRLVSQLLAVSTPNVSDALDRLGIEGAPQGILPIYPCAKIAGPAATLKVVPFGQAEESIVLGTLRAFWRVNRLAGILLLPYAAWALFAHGVRQVKQRFGRRLPRRH